jgi:O-methyltransferase involved in polyketide biosynthesis
VDLGGGTGGFLAALCERVPGIRGAIFDLPLVEQLASEQISERGHQDRVQFVAGDFFRDPLPKNADLYILGGILQDWDRGDGTRILENVYAALPDNGAVCIVESLFDDRRDGPYLTAMINLTMLVTNFGELRSPAEFDDWLTSIGFDRVEAHFLPAPRGVVVGWKSHNPE